MTWRVRVDPPIPHWERPEELIDEWILVERHVGARIEDLKGRDRLTVNIWSYNDPQARERDVFDSVDLSFEYIGEVALSAEALPDEPNSAEEWRRAFAKIHSFVETHGHSRIPESYRDEDGWPLAGLVGNIRWEHAGRSWLGPGPRPEGSGLFPGIDYATDLNELEGWTWEVETPEDIGRMRSTRFEAHIVHSLDLAAGADEETYVRRVTEALRVSEAAPWPQIRAEVSAHGDDPRTAILADFIPGRFERYFLGALITADRRILAFVLLFMGDPTEPERWHVLELREWRELSMPRDQDPYRAQIDAGMRILEQEQDGGGGA